MTKLIYMFTAGMNAGKLNDFETQQITQLRQHCLPPTNQITQILVGRAESHRTVAETLGLTEHGPIEQDRLWGIAGTLIWSKLSKQMMFRCNGRYTSSLAGFTMRLQQAMLSRHVQNGAILCTGRESATAIGISLKQVAATTCYEITITQNSEIKYRSWSDTRQKWSVSKQEA